MRIRELRRAPLRSIAVAALLALAGCQRAAPPTYVPPPPPVAPYQPAYQPPPAPTSEQTPVADACAGDIVRFCAGVPPRQGFIKECMKAHVNDLSAGCFDAVMSAIAAGQAP
jgi:cysteine rich repeat protein